MGCKVGCTEHEHYGAQLRAKGINVSPAATPSRRKHGKRRPIKQPSWERGIPTEKRQGGFEMPYLTESGRPMRIKEYGIRRHEIESIRDRQRNAPATPEGT